MIGEFTAVGIDGDDPTINECHGTHLAGLADSHTAVAPGGGEGAQDLKVSEGKVGVKGCLSDHSLTGVIWKFCCWGLGGVGRVDLLGLSWG